MAPSRVSGKFAGRDKGSLRSDSALPLDDDNKTELPNIHFWQLFKYSSKTEIVLFIIGIALSICMGVMFPLTLLLFSDLVDDFTIPGQMESYDTLIIQFAILGGVSFAIGYFQMMCLQLASKMQAKRVRKMLFTQALNQDVAWFDENSPGKMITLLTEGVDKIEAGCGEKLGIFLQYLVVFIAGVIIGYAKNWKLALVGTAMFPLVAASILYYGITVTKYTKKEREVYSKANTIASEVLGAVKTIFAFEGQKSQLKRYSSNLDKAEKLGIKKSTLAGLVFGSIDASMYVLLAVCCYYGITLLINQESLPGGVILVMFAMLIGGATIGQAFQQLEHFNNAKSAAAEIYPIIDRVPPIDKKASGTVLSDMEGNIDFKGVSFEYPLRHDVRVLNKVDIHIPAGKTVAIVGPSGSGKSTVIQLIQRFYDATDGDVLIDGVNLRDLDLISFRSQLGVVSQEPVLFADTVAENIRLGRPDATQEEIEEAAKLARAHDFITKLPDGYDTFLAEGGGGMSGGQKQRLAIARALIRNPRILLLDEATSALDTKSEKAVQRALDSARRGRTVVVVAHRLTTIRDADTILVMDGGVVREEGTHEELMALRGIYAKLVNKSGSEEDENDGDVKKDDDEDDDVENIIKRQEKEADKLTSPRLTGMGKKSDLFDDNDVSSVKSFTSSHMSLIDVDVEAKINVGKEVLSMNKPEMCYLVCGCLMNVLNGVAQACFAIVYTEIYDILGTGDNEEKLDRTARVSGALGGIAAIRLLCAGVGGYCMGVAGERLTKRCRIMLFEKMLRQEPGWFDAEENQPGILTGRLASDVPMLQSVSGRRLGSMVEMFSLIVSTLIIAFYFSWQITLVALAFFPILGIASFFEMRQMTGTTRTNVKGAGVANECLANARTVFNLGAEKHFIDRYEEQALMSKGQLFKGVALFALVSAIANSLTNFEMAALFSVAGKLIEDGTLTFHQVLKSYSAISFAASNLGYIATFAPDSKKATVAGQQIFELINREPELLPDEGEFPDKPFQGAVAFKSVTFAYPTRKKTKVLRAFSHEVQPGKSVAFVGQSGCGKSTLLQLVQRFYDPTVRNDAENFGVSFDGVNLQTLAPNWIRRQIGVVSQEPNLIDMTIRENIAFGLNYQEGEPSMETIISAAKQANAHKFIEDLPEGYETSVGPRGSHLSGGQKQRIAIARALVRNPRLLLLDEATAALDNESERVVQAALDEAMKAGERTTLVVAHRLTTVDKCDLIVVVEGGKCVESGPPGELLAAKGKFYELNNADVNIKRD